MSSSIETDNDSTLPSQNEHMHQLAEAQQQALNQIENIVQNQQALHRELAQRRAMEVHLQDGTLNDDDGHTHRRDQRQRQDVSPNNIGRYSTLSKYAISVVLLAIFVVIYSKHSVGVTEAKPNDAFAAENTVDTIKTPRHKRSLETALDLSGNPLAQTNGDSGWDAIINNFHVKESEKNQGTAPKHQDDTVDSSSSISSESWGIIHHWKEKYQLFLERLEQEPYFLSLTPHKSKEQGSSGTSVAKTSQRKWGFIPWNHREASKTTNHVITMMNTRGRLQSIALDGNTHGVLSTLLRCVDFIMDLFDAVWTSGDGQNEVDDESTFLDKLIESTPRLLLIANAFLLLTYLLHIALADFFLGPVRVGNGGADTTGAEDAVRPRNVEQNRQLRGREKVVGYLLFKVLLISAVVTPDTLDLLVLLLWYATLSLLRSLCHVAGSAINHATQSGLPPKSGALLLLLVLLVCDGLAIVACSQLFDTWSMFLLLTADGIILGDNVMMHILRYSVAAMEEKHRDTMTQLEERIATIQNRRREVDVTDTAAVQSLEEESLLRDRDAEAKEIGHNERMAAFDKLIFMLELFSAFGAGAHYIHIWVLHGATFGLVDAILLLHIQSTLSSVGRKIAERRNLYRIIREIDEAFDDASDLDIRKASTSGDVCCICLISMTAGKVKKAGCGHLFHTNCLQQVVERARSLRASKCPLCRASLIDGSHLRQQNNASVDNDTQPVDVEVLAQPPVNNNQQVNPNLNEQSLFRFSTEGILPAWLPVPSFAFEVVRRETPVIAEQNNAAGGVAGGLQRFFRRGGAVDTNGDTNNGNEANDGGQEQQQQQQSFWRRLFVLAGAIPLSPEEEAVALDQLTDMFPQYDRADLARELRARGSSEAVVEAIFLGIFSGVARGGGGEGGGGNN